MEKTKVAVDARVQIKDAHISGRLGKGKATCGALIISETGEKSIFSKYLGEMTVPEAEFRGLIFALDQAAAISRKEIEVWMDSELVIKWMNGEYRMKKEHIRPLFDEAKKYAQRFKNVEYFHHSRETELARRADKIAEEEFKKHQ
jgi:ribonuclease HI